MSAFVASLGYMHLPLPVVCLCSAVCPHGHMHEPKAWSLIAVLCWFAADHPTFARSAVSDQLPLQVAFVVLSTVCMSSSRLI